MQVFSIEQHHADCRVEVRGIPKAVRHSRANPEPTLIAASDCDTPKNPVLIRYVVVDNGGGGSWPLLRDIGVGGGQGSWPLSFVGPIKRE